MNLGESKTLKSLSLGPDIGCDRTRAPDDEMDKLFAFEANSELMV